MSTQKALVEHRLDGNISSEPIAEVSFVINSVRDVMSARTNAREMALWIGFNYVQSALVSVVASELARNIAEYASPGQVTLAAVFKASKYGIVIIARDQGPGIPDIDMALEEGYSTSGRLGMRLTEVRKAVNEFYITSKVGQGTTVTAIKWLE
jgi:serine/threonine-protein kinase RsbT